MNEKTAGILSVIITFIAIIGLSILSDKLGFATYIDYGETITIEHQLYEEEKDGSISNVGWYILIVTSMLGWKLYHWFISGKIFGNLKYEQRLLWNYWFIGLTIVTLLTEIIYMFDLHYLILRFSLLAILIATAWIFFRSYEKKLTSYSKAEREAKHTEVLSEEKKLT